MAKMVYDEYYGEIGFAERTAIRKHNVSPSDYQDVLEAFRMSRIPLPSPELRTKLINAFSTRGMFSASFHQMVDWINDTQH